MPDGYGVGGSGGQMAAAAAAAGPSSSAAAAAEPVAAQMTDAQRERAAKIAEKQKKGVLREAAGAKVRLMPRPPTHALTRRLIEEAVAAEFL